MSLFDTLINDITNDITNGTPLMFAAKNIHKMYTKYLSQLFFSHDRKDTVSLNELNNILKPKVMHEYGNIVKLIFDDNNKYLYVSIKLLLEIDYFKNMIDGYDFGDEYIIEIKLCKEMDNYDVICDILTFANNCNDYEYSNVKFQYLYDVVMILDYMGPVYSGNRSMIESITQNNICEYTNATLQNCDHLYNILKQNNVYDTIGSMRDIWNNIIDLDNNVEKILTMPLFNNVILFTEFGMSFVIKHKAYAYYPKICGNDNYKIIVDHLLDEDSVEAWEIIIKCFEYWRTYCTTMPYLMENINKITDTVFNIDVKELGVDLLMELVIKFKKNEYINYIGQKLSTYYNNTTRNKLCTYIDEITNSDGTILRDLYTHYFKYPSGYKDKIANVITFHPLVYTSYICVGMLNNYNNPQQKIFKKTYIMDHDVTLFYKDGYDKLYDFGCLKNIIVDYENNKNVINPIINYNGPNMLNIYVYIQEL